MLDPRTLLILHKWVKSGTLSEITGCVSTGKEANVYQATRDPVTTELEDKNTGVRLGKEGGMVYGDHGHMEYAIKVFKTSILVFKARGKYVEGEFRFRKNGYQKSNP